MTFSIKPFIIRTLCFFSFRSRMGRYDRFHFLAFHPVIKVLSSIPSIRNQMVKNKTLHKRDSLSLVMTLSCCQLQTQRIAQPIYRDMNLGAEPTTTTAQRLGCLTATFFVRLQRKDVLAQWCYQSSHFPCLGHQRNALASVPICPGRTSGRSVCRRCSISRILLVIAAIANRCGLSREHLRQNGGILLHFFRYKHAGLLSESPESFPIAYYLISRLT